MLVLHQVAPRGNMLGLHARYQLLDRATRQCKPNKQKYTVNMLVTKRSSSWGSIHVTYSFILN